jgi:signal transduction histidine kinase
MITNITPAIAAFFTTSLVITRQVSRLREMADEALLSIHRKLIDAEERERTRIARELHDDINQRIALMALDLEQLEQTPSESVAEASSYIQKLVQRLSEIGADLHAISPRNRKLGFAHGTGSSPG